MSESKIKVLVKRSDERGHITWMSNTLEAFQRAVGGHIEAVTLFEDLVVICNEEGRLLGLEPNCRIAGIDFVGTIIFAGVGREDFTSIPDALTMKFFREVMLHGDEKC